MESRLKRITPEAIEYGKKRWDLIHRAREVMPDDDPRDPDDLDNETLEQIVAHDDSALTGEKG